MILAVLAFVGFMQAAPPLPLPAQAPAPVPSAPRAQSPAPSAPVVTAQSLSTLTYDADALSKQRLANEGFEALSSIWNLPGWLSGSRLPENTVDQPQSADMNHLMVGVAMGLIPIAFLLVLGYNAFSVSHGQTPNPFAAVAGITVVAIAAFVAVHNRDAQQFPVALVNLILDTISAAPLRDYGANGRHVINQGSLVWGAIVALALLLVMIYLTVILFIEGCWVIILGANMALWSLGMAVPIFGGGAQYMVRRWLGSLFSPILCFTALHLATEIMANIFTGPPDLGQQMAMIGFAICATQAPGMMVGAISASFPGVAQMYASGRLIGGAAGRIMHGDWAIPSNDGGGNGSGGNPNVRQDPPRARGGPPHSRTIGFGRAASGKLTPQTA